MIRLKDILHDREIKQAIALYKKVEPHKLNQALQEKLILPNLDRMNRDLDQDNCPRYLAYCVEYCLMHMKIERKPSKHDARNKDTFLSNPPKGQTPNQTSGGRTGQTCEPKTVWFKPSKQPARHRKEA
jgi:hypothetical protein